MNMTATTLRVFMAVLLTAVSIGNASEGPVVKERVQKTQAKSDGLDHTFTYSLIAATEAPAGVLKRIQSDVVPTLKSKGATLYSVWIPPADPVDKLPERGNFKGLLESQLGFMLAWPKQGPKAKELDAAFMSVEGVESVQTRAYDPIYLIQTGHGFEVRTETRIYVQREARYRPQDVEEVTRLSKAAWNIYDPLYGTKVIGLFRERSTDRNVATLYRIVWYPDLAAWKKTRMRDDRPKVQEVRRIFKQRSALQLHEEIGPAWAADRATP